DPRGLRDRGRHHHLAPRGAPVAVRERARSGRWFPLSTISWLVIGVSVLLLLAWYLSYSAARLDRLHAKVEGALSALDAHLVRRAEAALELANSGALDPASAFLIVRAATGSLERVTE